MYKLSGHCKHDLEMKFTDNVEHAWPNGGMLDTCDDTASGQALLDTWCKGSLRQGGVALQFLIDSAQLYADRCSEAWFCFIWVIHNLLPNIHYKNAFVIPGAIIPGPNKPWYIDLFMFPLLYHIVALQHEGLTVYDASLTSLVQSLLVTLCKKESQVKLKKMAFSHEKSKEKSQKTDFSLTFHDWKPFFLTFPDFHFYRGWELK